MQVGSDDQLAPPDLGTIAVGNDQKIYVTKLAYGMKRRTVDQGALPVLLDGDGAALIIQAGDQPIACAVLR
jgi:hypothetical protein